MGSKIKPSKLPRKYRYVAGIECPACETKFWSRYGHDFRYCPCGYCFVDGGRNYLRYGWGDKADPILSNDYAGTEIPRSIKMRIYEDDPDYRSSENRKGKKVTQP